MLSPSQSREASSSSNSHHPPPYHEVRQQAGPLPSKRGEIGFMEGIHIRQEVQQDQGTMPARHPADRDPPPDATIAPLPAAVTLPNTAAESNLSDSTSTSSESESALKESRLLFFLKRKKVTSFGGLRLLTLFAFLAQLVLLAGFLLAWVFTTVHINQLARNGNSLSGGLSSSVFIHVVFLFAVIGQLIFLERRVYRLRAERYTYLHPGELLPRYRDRIAPGGDLAFAYAPWNRPPLPTYAATLAQSGYGTGDADDHLIAAPPPPAYGNTRGSTLLLSGFLRDSLRAQRPQSVYSQTTAERPLSHVGSHAGLEEPQNADRNQQLQQTLAQLERPRIGS